MTDTSEATDIITRWPSATQAKFCIGTIRDLPRTYRLQAIEELGRSIAATETGEYHKTAYEAITGKPPTQTKIRLSPEGAAKVKAVIEQLDKGMHPFQSPPEVSYEIDAPLPRRTVKSPTWASVAVALGIGVILGYTWRTASYEQDAANHTAYELASMLTAPLPAKKVTPKGPTDAERFARGELPGYSATTAFDDDTTGIK